eukprot:4847280-Amphidinium_carterae.1
MLHTTPHHTCLASGTHKCENPITQPHGASQISIQLSNIYKADGSHHRVKQRCSLAFSFNVAPRPVHEYL